MQAEIVELQERTILGIQARINPMAADYGDLWGRQFEPHRMEIDPLAVEEGYYSAYFGTEEEGMADFVGGVVVAQGTEAPAGLVARPLGGGTYAKFACTMSTIGPTWGGIYGQWLPTSGYVEDESRPGIEYYPPGDQDSPDAPVHVYIAVRPA